MNGLDLFSGIGGIELALSPWVRTVAYCEVDRYCQSLLLSRMQSGDISKAPIWDDVRTLNSKLLPKIDIIYGGFPCQDISTAGRGAGLAGKRSGLFFEIIRLTEELRPSFVFLENVPAITTRGLDAVLGEFSKLRYDCRWTIVSAAELGAPHLRKRWFMLAKNRNSETVLRKEIEWRESNRNFKWPKALADTDSKSVRIESGRRCGKSWESQTLSQLSCENVPDAESIGSIEGRLKRREASSKPEFNIDDKYDFKHNSWSFEPDVGRMANGIPFRVDRLRGLGNSVVPAQAREAFKRLSGLDESTKGKTKCT